MKRFPVALSAAVVLTLGVGVALTQLPRRAPAGRPMVRRPMPPGEPPAGLVFRLSEGTPAATSVAPVKVAPGAPLSDAEADALLARMPALAAEPADQADFALRDSSLPAPRTGATVQVPFPPPSEGGAAERPPAGPLEVVRRSPEGDVPLAPNLSVTFSQPMVAVGSHADLAREQVPVKISPQPAGEWRWVGAKTVVFQPQPRLPMATEFTVEIPEGTRSAVGGRLAQTVRWTFSTPPPALETTFPRDIPTRRNPVLFASFDQKIDQAAVLATLRLRPAGFRSLPALRLATAAEIDADPDVASLRLRAQEGRSIAFTPVEPLPPDTSVEVVLGPGTPSAEGPRRTAKAQTWSFKTFGPLRIVEQRCGWDGCRPFTPWQLQFSNPLDAKTSGKDMVRVTPELPDMVTEVYGTLLSIRGRSKGRTTYGVTLSGRIADVFGQTLGEDEVRTFAVGPAEPALFAPGGDFVVLDPSAPPRFSVFTMNQPSVKVRAYVVAPEDWPAFGTFRQESYRNVGAKPPGRLALDRSVPVRGGADELVETPIDLAALMPGGRGHVVLVIQPAVQPKEQWRRLLVLTWVQATDIGLDAWADETGLTLWTTSLASGQPLAGVDVGLIPTGGQGRSAADGLVRLEIPATLASAVVARKGKDAALLPRSPEAGSTYGWVRNSRADELRWYVVDDRKMYRPGEEVRVKGWIRSTRMNPTGDIEALGEAMPPVGYRLMDSRGNEILKGAAPAKAFGAFDLALTLPKTMNLGPTRLELSCPVAGVNLTRHDHFFEVQEFRRPEYEVTVTAGDGPRFVRDHVLATVKAAYYAGGGLGNAEVTWRVEARPASFVPPGRDDFTFGTWTPWWEPEATADTSQVQTLAGHTDSSGRHDLRIDLDAVRPPRASHLRAEASVTDVNRQAWTGSVEMLVHPATLYVGLRSDRVFVDRGQPLRVDAIVSDLDGQLIPGQKVTLTAERLRGVLRDHAWTEEVADSQQRELTSAAESVRATFETPEGGVYRITARVVDREGRPNESQLRLWVAGEKRPPQRNVEEEKVTLVPARKEYRGGETAEVLVVAPFAPAEGLMSLSRLGTLRTERFSLREGTHTLRIPIEEAWTPDVWVQVDLVGAAPRATDAGAVDPKLPRRPAFATGRVELKIPPFERTLKVEALPRQKALEPGGETVIDLALSDARGRAIPKGEALVVVVDEAVLALTGYRLPDPVETFYAQRGSSVDGVRLRAHLQLGRPETLNEDQLGGGGEGGVAGGVLGLADASAMRFSAAMAPMAAPPPAMRAKAAMGAGAEAEAAPIRGRTDFGALALFAASVVTDASGRASVPVKLPDNLTRYRIMAVATDGTRQFGHGESTLTARLPLMARPSPPRFLNFGDLAEVPIVLQNQTDEPFEVRVAMRGTNVRLTEARGYRVQVPANDRVEVRFPVATEKAGRARFQVAAAAGRFADGANFDLPVWTPATTEAFATYGQIDQGAIVQPVRAPSAVVKGFGGLEVTTSSTALQALTDAVLYLTRYPYECTEQMSSRVLGIAALRDVLGAFKAEGLPPAEDLVASVKRDLTLLSQLQNEDGGFAFWRRGDESWPYVSIHVAHALARAREKGFDVPKASVDRSLGYLRQIESHIPGWYGVEARRTLIAYALRVRQLLGERDGERARKLVREAGVAGLSFEALGFVLPVLSGDASAAADVAAIRTHLGNRVAETAGAAHFAVDYGDGAYLLLYSDRRADAILLEALILDQPESDIIPKLVAGLLGHRKAGRWLNTQENVFVLLALDRYFNTYEKVTPDFVARMWLGPRYAGEQAFRGRSTDRRELRVPMATLMEHAGAQDLILAKEGVGRLYYRIGLRYAPESLKLEPLDRGFTVERRYEPIDRPGDVARAEDGTWRIQAGARVRVHLTMVAPGRRYHVALVDPLPAGLETLNPELKTTGTLPQGPDDTVGVMGAPGLGGPGRPGSWWWWRRTWYEHQNMRDERVEAFASLLWEGVYDYSYVARATTPGRFVVPPAKAEEMYAPETFGRSATDHVIVE